MRNLITVAAVLAMLAGGQAYGQVSIDYKLLLDGDNHAAEYHSTGTFPAYTGGSDADIAVERPVGTIFNWAVQVAVTGNDPASGYAPAGAANLVFDLELHAGTAEGPLVAIGHGSPAVAGFFSTINDGSAEGDRTNPVQDAAFASVFSIGFPLGNVLDGGRLIDTVASSGPNLDFSTYPSDAGHPAASTAAAGKLVGMGAGYKELKYSGPNSTTNRVGVGIATDANMGGFCAALGVQVLFEGQINTAGLPGGDYVLVLKAGTGNNIVPSDTEQFPVCDTNFLGGKFAVAASAVTGDTISFKLASVDPACVAPVMTAAKSWKTHVSTDYAVDLLAKQTETRNNGPTKVVVTFDRAIKLATGTAADVALAGGGTVTAVSASGSDLTVTLSGVPNASYTTMTFPGVGDGTPKCTGIAMSASQLCIGTLKGDYNNDKAVNVLDLIQVRNKQNTTPDGTTFRGDVNVDGAINVLDLIQVRNLQNTAVIKPTTGVCAQ